MKDSTALPHLEMLPTDALVLHEECDPRRVEKLCQRIRDDAHLKHPPIVAALPETDRFVVLDGANRTMSLRALRIPHVVAQVVSYGDPGVELGTWHHVVAGMRLDDFEKGLTEVDRLNLHDCTLDEARAAIATGDAAAYIVCASGVRKVVSENGSRARDIHLLTDLVGVYKGRADIFRASNDIWEIQAPFYPNITALIVFPPYSPADIMMLARRGEKVPTGVTRHVIPNRALYINIPLDVLGADWTLERKREWLRQWLMEQ
ncbi:MAG: hypothetical protein AB1817_17370, partial [Chloroflexota bacterium]